MIAKIQNNCEIPNKFQKVFPQGKEQQQQLTATAQLAVKKWHHPKFEAFANSMNIITVKQTIYSNFGYVLNSYYFFRERLKIQV